MTIKVSSEEDLYQNGKKLPIVETFYTIQGEGFHTGKPAFFVRIGGCDIGCSWCDTKFSWNSNLHKLVDIKDILDTILASGSDSVVVTGGEPLSYNLDKFCNLLKSENLKTFLETSGAYHKSGEWDWICLSPKQNNPPIKGNFKIANELKVIIQTVNDFAWAEDNARKVSKDCKLFLQPEWSQYDKIIPKIIDYAKADPKWSISLQAHKFMRIP